MVSVSSIGKSVAQNSYRPCRQAPASLHTLDQRLPVQEGEASETRQTRLMVSGSTCSKARRPKGGKGRRSETRTGTSSPSLHGSGFLYSAHIRTKLLKEARATVPSKGVIFVTRELVLPGSSIPQARISPRTCSACGHVALPVLVLFASLPDAQGLGPCSDSSPCRFDASTPRDWCGHFAGDAVRDFYFPIECRNNTACAVIPRSEVIVRVVVRQGCW